MSGDLICRHQEEPQIKVYEPEGKTSFSTNFKYVDVVRETETDVDSAVSQQARYQ